MDIELIETLQLIIDRYEGRTQGSVFIPMRDFPWYNESNDQLKKLHEAGMITKPRYFDNGAEITLTKKGRNYFKDMNAEKVEKPTVFVSYNWGSNVIAEELERNLKPYADVKRDKTSVKPWGDLPSFMSSIRDQDFAVLVISDAYLKSDACLFEVMELMKEQQWDERVMYVVTDDAHGIYDTKKQLEYIGYWDEKEQHLKTEIKKYNPAAVTAQAAELKKVELIALNIGTFVAKVKQTKNPEMKDAINAVVERVRGSGHHFSESLTNQTNDSSEDEVTVDEIEVPELLRDGWNFHNDIALRLEMEARHVFGDRSRPNTKIYDADFIETGHFAEIMIDVLREKTGRVNGRDDLDSFIKTCSNYIGKNGYQIDPRISQGLLNRFFELMG